MRLGTGFLFSVCVCERRANERSSWAALSPAPPPRRAPQSRTTLRRGRIYFGHIKRERYIFIFKTEKPRGRGLLRVAGFVRRFGAPLGFTNWTTGISGLFFFALPVSHFGFSPSPHPPGKKTDFFCKGSTVLEAGEYGHISRRMILFRCEGNVPDNCGFLNGWDYCAFAAWIEVIIHCLCLGK